MLQRVACQLFQQARLLPAVSGQAAATLRGFSAAPQPVEDSDAGEGAARGPEPLYGTVGLTIDATRPAPPDPTSTVRPDGLIEMSALEAAIRPDTALVSIMAVNNEIGVLQPMDAIGALCRARGVVFHTDGAQAVGKIPVDVNASKIDLMSISGHKLYGPKGVGALYVRPSPSGEAMIEKKGISLRGVPLYLDMQATTPMDPRVIDAMLPYMTEQFGNPHSRTHLYGWESEEAVEDARAKIARLIGADPKEIIFTSGATESNNTAIKGVATYLKDKKRHVITVRPDGLIEMSALEAAIRPDTALVSIMAVNNEIGVLQPMDAIGALCRARGVVFHTDGAQVWARGRIVQI
ncbi:putative cysteine desulfurase, mitochondrial [Tetrabaena socialis]|uniref:cysteine desulfurase n=1 Tax=Tetrabaena socialis TaxID=47790 RepID=A0A2J7ZUL6_9CHLO|nr:putative cysteine desulfurase, mitochondrial [Tetrabaena socialis]|eukprot:PNH03964.1 putative cysteine desulfurase, mitochondrial [Tetrabaena socialis]